MGAVGKCAINTYILCNANFGTVCTNSTFAAQISTAITIALGALGAMHSIADSTLDAYLGTCFLRAVSTDIGAIITLPTRLAPLANIKITSITHGTMVAEIGGTFLTYFKTQSTCTAIIIGCAILAQSTLTAPSACIKIAGAAAKAMESPFHSAILAKMLTMGGGAWLIIGYAIRTHTAVLTPDKHLQITGITSGAMGALLNSAGLTHFSAFLT